MAVYVQGNGDARDDHSEDSRSSRDVSDRHADRKHISIRSRSRSRSQSADRSRSHNQSRDRHSRHEEGYRDKYRDKSAPKERGSRQDLDGKEARRVVQFDPRGDSRHSRDRHHSRDSRSGRDSHRHHRSHSHPSRHTFESDRGHSRDSSDRKRRRDDAYPSPSEGKTTFLWLHACLLLVRSPKRSQCAPATSHMLYLLVVLYEMRQYLTASTAVRQHPCSQPAVGAQGIFFSPDGFFNGLSQTQMQKQHVVLMLI